MPKCLQEFLMGDTLKVGLSLKDDFQVIRRRKNVHAEEGNWIELQDYVGKLGIEDRSLQKLYANLLGGKISKSQQLSNWEAETLTDAQMKYAATDAWACVQIYNCLQNMEKEGYELIKITNNDDIQENIS